MLGHLLSINMVFSPELIFLNTKLLWSTSEKSSDNVQLIKEKLCTIKQDLEIATCLKLIEISLLMLLLEVHWLVMLTIRVIQIVKHLLQKLKEKIKLLCTLKGILNKERKFHMTIILRLKLKTKNWFACVDLQIAMVE